MPQAPAGEPVEAEEIEKLNGQEDELCGVMGMSITDAHATFPAGTGSCIAPGTPVKTGFEATLGRPDVSISELDSGILWNDRGDMLQLRSKLLLNAGELPAPKVDMTKTFDPSTGVDCETAHARHAAATTTRYGGMPGGKPGASGPIPYDIAGQGVFDTLAYACDSRVANVVETYPQCTNPPTTKACRNGPPGMLTPEDLIIAFSDGIDHDHNGYVNDIAGWNFVDNNNDPYDDVHYGHGTGEDEDSTAEADTALGEIGACPNCTVLPLRVGESFVADANRFAEADDLRDRPRREHRPGGARHLQRPRLRARSDRLRLRPRRHRDRLGRRRGRRTPQPARRAAAHDRRQRARGPGEPRRRTVTNKPPSYLQLDGCTNFGTRIDLSVPLPRAPRRRPARARASPG